MLGYLPCDKSRWSEELDRSRKLYSQWHMDLIVNPRKEFEKEQEEKEKKAEEDEDPELQEITQGDHVLLSSSKILNLFSLLLNTRAASGTNTSKIAI